MSEHEFKFLVSVSHSTINVMDWRIFPSAYGHIYKKLIMEQPIIITPPVGTINQNECLSFLFKKKVFWRPVWFKLFCTSAEPAVTLLSVWRCRNLASFYLPLTPRNPHVRKLFICIRKKQFAFWAVTLTIGNFFLFLCFQLKMKKNHDKFTDWLVYLLLEYLGGWIFRSLIELVDKSGLTVRAWFVWIPDKGLSPWISMLQMAAE